ncbi:MAG: polyprenyl synthetase family protein [Ignavibacteriales bacterium]|nr:All-trans-nonaprenyl-diphosphate synthase (geranyl-diphosphate specific) [Ignavibacteriaceae bacterium]MCZ2142495.1 polyprenyl synthetase family protein [Ignavibacteriales bacterium]WKZ72838.1 MAG: polyprenyl synthetase family protein [Ignavibacteriaceae bacterium]
MTTTISATENYNKIYNELKTEIDGLLARVMQGRQPASLYEPGAYIMESPGKRIRPLLVLFSAKAVGGNYDRVMNAAVAVEMLHNFTLVHDDIMDNSEKRRGRATLHVKYDLSTAILTGDVLLAAAYEHLQKDLNGNARAVEYFTRGLIEVCEGQSLDKDFENREEVTLAEYLVMIGKKTAALLQMCCTVGATLGGGSDREIEALGGYGRLMGLAFQVRDDLLDITADAVQLGKPVGGDILEGKKSFLLLKALQKAGAGASPQAAEDRNMLRRLIANKGADAWEIPAFKAMYQRLGVIADAENEVEKLTLQALEKLNVLKNEEDRELFTSLANALLNRTK